MYGSGIRGTSIVYWVGKNNVSARCLEIFVILHQYLTLEKEKPRCCSMDNWGSHVKCLRVAAEGSF